MSACIRVLELAYSANSCEEADEPVASVKPARPANELLVKIFAFEMLWEDTRLRTRRLMRIFRSKSTDVSLTNSRVGLLRTAECQAHEEVRRPTQSSTAVETDADQGSNIWRFRWDVTSHWYRNPATQR